MKKALILASVVVFAISCTKSDEQKHQERIDSYLEQNERCLEHADGLGELLVCQDIFNRQMDAEFQDLNRRLEEILRD